MTDWKLSIDLEAPFWQGYRELIEALPGEKFPDTASLNTLLRAGTVSRGGPDIRFTAAAELPGVAYEQHIYETGQVSTRENSWHDLFNALVWCRLPRLKATMNFLHFEHMGQGQAGGRGSVRDALTLLDESGVIVSSSNIDLLNAIACRDWNMAFVTNREIWNSGLTVLVCGHAILEKFLDPYKSITAHALLLHTTGRLSAKKIDRALGASLAGNGWLTAPSGLSPLPLMGIPGWWHGGDQDSGFYTDQKVFRPASEDKPIAPIFSLPL